MKLNNLFLIFITCLVTLSQALAVDEQWQRLTGLVYSLHALQESQGPFLDIAENIAQQRTDFLSERSAITAQEIFQILRTIMRDKPQNPQKMENIFKIISDVGQLTILPDDLSKLISKSSSTGSWWDTLFEQAIELHKLDKDISRLVSATDSYSQEQLELLSIKLKQVELNLFRTLRYMSEIYKSSNITMMYSQIIDSQIDFLSEGARRNVLVNFESTMKAIQGINNLMSVPADTFVGELGFYTDQFPMFRVADEWGNFGSTQVMQKPNHSTNHYLHLIVRSIVYNLFGPHFEDMKERVLQEYRSHPKTTYP